MSEQIGGPLQRVLASFADGARTLDDVATMTDLDPEMVDSAIAHLRRMGRIDAQELSMGCPSGGCGTCACGHGDASPGCGAPGPSTTRRGPVLVQLRLRPRS